MVGNKDIIQKKFSFISGLLFVFISMWWSAGISHIVRFYPVTDLTEYRIEP